MSDFNAATRNPETDYNGPALGAVSDYNPARVGFGVSFGTDFSIGQV
jgi:hypothetical protein